MNLMHRIIPKCEEILKKTNKIHEACQKDTGSQQPKPEKFKLQNSNTVDYTPNRNIHESILMKINEQIEGTNLYRRISSNKKGWGNRK